MRNRIRERKRRFKSFALFATIGLAWGGTVVALGSGLSTNSLLIIVGSALLVSLVGIMGFLGAPVVGGWLRRHLAGVDTWENNDEQHGSV